MRNRLLALILEALQALVNVDRVSLERSCQQLSQGPQPGVRAARLLQTLHLLSSATNTWADLNKP